MTTSQNGWPASADRAAINVDPNFTVAGVTFPGGVKAGDVSLILRTVAQHWHDHIERLHAGWCWGHYFKPIVGGGGVISNHGSATAFDINAPAHPRGTRTMSSAQIGEVRVALDKVRGVVRWGGDFGGTSVVDQMHCEINGNAAAVARVAALLRGTPPTLPQPSSRPTIQQGATGTVVRELQFTLNRWYPALPALTEDGVFGAKTTDRVRYFQGRAGLTVDGVVGPRTWAFLGFK